MTCSGIDNPPGLPAVKYCFSWLCNRGQREFGFLPELLGTPVPNAGNSGNYDSRPIGDPVDPCLSVNAYCASAPRPDGYYCVDGPCDGSGDRYNPSCGVFGVCCVSGTTYMTSQDGCAYYGGRWVGVGPFPPECGDPCNQSGACCNDATCSCVNSVVSQCSPTGHTFYACEDCASSPCGTVRACCGCDWCCDYCSTPPCEALKTYPWQNLPVSRAGQCPSPTVCPTSAGRPVCRRAEFAVGRRPQAHEPPCATPDPTNRIGRHELHSLNPIRARDLRPPADTRNCQSSSVPACDKDPECRIYYGHVGRGAPLTPTQRTVGWLCGQENRCQSSTKRANRCYPNKRADGRHSFECAYRSPCPEKPAVCL